VGNVENGDMHLKELGEIAQQCFEKIPEHFPFVSLDSFVIMPNHVHGIIIIKPSSLSVIIRSCKSAVSKQARQIHPDFVWQSRYYDHIIRDEKSLNNIRHYIIQNPLNWQADAENPVRNTNESVENAD